MESDSRLQPALDALRRAGAVFVLLHGSRARGTAHVDSDIDLAAYWGQDPPLASDVLLPSGVDLLVLDGAPLELAGRVAQEGELLLDTDPAARVRWIATTRKIYADELPRLRRAHADFVEAVRRGR